MSATTTPAATLAGGIRATIANAARSGATLSLADSGRVLSLTLTPDQVAELAAWEPIWMMRGFVPQPFLYTDDLWSEDIVTFVRRVRGRLAWDFRSLHQQERHDIAALAALARAALPLVCPAGEGEGHE